MALGYSIIVLGVQAFVYRPITEYCTFILSHKDNYNLIIFFPCTIIVSARKIACKGTKFFEYMQGKSWIFDSDGCFLCLGHLSALFHYVQTIIPMFALQTRAAHLLLECPLDTLRCALTASRSCVAHLSVDNSLAAAKDFCNWRRRTSLDGSSVRYCATRMPDLSN